MSPACTAANVKNRRIVFSPETEAASTGKEYTIHRPAMVNGVPTVVEYKQTSYSHTPVMLKDVRFELAQGTMDDSAIEIEEQEEP